MTEHQVQLIDSEILRHISMSMASTEPSIKRSHLEVATALATALDEVSGRRIDHCQVFKSAHLIDSFLRLSQEKLQGN